ncbi:MAG: GTP 3',8-cyclase MoaA, partial [Candidatus Bathyarchaeia archaeon]
MLLDKYNRPLLNFRIAVTPACNQNCFYCHREGYINNLTLLSVNEIIRITKIAAEFGVKTVKITGGEPLMRKDIKEIIKGLKGIQGLEDISLVTNAKLLTEELAFELKDAGLSRVNISLPSLTPTIYKRITGGEINGALRGIKAAINAGLTPVKLNMVILKGLNDHEINVMIDAARNIGATLQLIEFEPVNISFKEYIKYHLSLDKIEKEIAKKAEKVEIRNFMHNRKVYTIDGVKVEVVKPIENTEFCAHCTRMRLTFDGKLKPCLMRSDNLVDVLPYLRSG